MPTPYSQFIQELIHCIEEKHLLKHPFYQLWAQGRLPLSVMRSYAEQYYHLERNFPRFLSRMHAECEQFDVRQSITDNLYDEEHGEENHRELWLRFAECIGAQRKEVMESTPLSETQYALDTFMELSSTSTLSGTGALAAYESQIPAVAEKKLEGLREHYNITDERGTAFFRVHGVMDIQHANEWWDIIDQYADTDEKKTEVRGSVERGRDALWKFLDGICRAYMPKELKEEVEQMYAARSA